MIDVGSWDVHRMGLGIISPLLAEATHHSQCDVT